MGVLNKLKSIFYDEVELEDTTDVEDVKPTITKREVEKPVVEEVKVKKDIEPIEEVKPVNTKIEDTFSERDLFRSEKTFNFAEFDDEEEDNLPPRKNVLNVENRNNAVNTNNISTPVRAPEVKAEPPRVFKPTPVISPIYGILDKDYKREDIQSKTNNEPSIKVTTYDSVRRKAYGTLEDDLEDTLNSISKLSTKTVNEKSNEFDREAKKAEIELDEKTQKIEDLINRIEETTNEIDRTMSIGELESNVPLENFEDEEYEEDLGDKTMTDSTLEHDLFNLIDSMYDDKED